MGAAEEKDRTKPSQVRSSGALQARSADAIRKLRWHKLFGHGFRVPSTSQNLVSGQLPVCRLSGTRRPSFCFELHLRLPSPYFPYIIEYTLGNREAQWRVLEAKTNEMRSSTPQPVYLRSAVLPLPQRQRYQNKLASPRELFLRTSTPRVI